jgi:hypothetical protein
MKYGMIVASAVAVGFLGALAVPAQADECDKLTYFTFASPVALPGVTLPAGTYRFAHPDCGMSSGLLRVSSPDGTEVYGTFLTIPAERRSPSSRPDVTFGEAPAGSVEAIETWFYPGDTTGDRLIYPTNEAARVAQAPVQRTAPTPGT